MASALVHTSFDRYRNNNTNNNQHVILSKNEEEEEDAMKKIIPSLAPSFPPPPPPKRVLEASDNSRSLKRKKSMSLNEEEQEGGRTSTTTTTITSTTAAPPTVAIVSVDLGSLSRDQKRELRKRLKLNLDQVRSITAKIDVREEHLLLSTKSSSSQTVLLRVPEQKEEEEEEKQDTHANNNNNNNKQNSNNSNNNNNDNAACNSDAHLSRTDGNNGSSTAGGGGKEATSAAAAAAAAAAELLLLVPSASAEDTTTATRGTAPAAPPPLEMVTVQEARLARQPSILVTEGDRGDLGTPGAGAAGGRGGAQQGKEKRTPNKNQLYVNAEFVSGKEKMPPPEKLKPKGSGSSNSSTPGMKRGAPGGPAAGGAGGQGKRQKVEAARAKRMADILRQCSTLLKRMMSHKHAWVFNEPVDAEKLGLHDYHKVIKKPMDLGTVKDRIAAGFYSSSGSFSSSSCSGSGSSAAAFAFADDVRLTFVNAMAYNPQGHDVYVMAQVLLGLFNDRWKDIARKLEEEDLKIKVEEETLSLDFDNSSSSIGQQQQQQQQQKQEQKPQQQEQQQQQQTAASSLHDLHEHLKRVETQIQSLARSSSSSRRPSAAAGPAAAQQQQQQAKLRADDVEKRAMTFEEKRKLSVNLESLPGDKLEWIVQIIKKRNPDVGQNEDEIEVDIDSFDNDTLWELDHFITNCMKSRGKKAAKKKAGANQKVQQQQQQQRQHGLFSQAPPQTHVATGETRKTRAGGEGGEEDVDIDDDLAPAQFAPVVIDKDGGIEAGGIKSSSSDSDSSDSGSSSSDSDSGSLSGSKSEAEDAQSARAGSKAAHEKEPVGSAAVGNSKSNLALQPDNTKRDEVIVEETPPPERQVSPNKLLRAALLRGRFADTILKAQEKTLPVDKNEKADPEKVRKDHEDLERRQKEEKARLQAEAMAAKREAALEARRVREMEREAARRALQQMEKTVEIDENSEILKDLERLRSVPMEQLVGSSGEEGSPNGGSSDGLPAFPLQGGNPLEWLGLVMKEDEDEDEHQGDVEDVQADNHRKPVVQSEPDHQAEGKPAASTDSVDVEEGEID